MAGNTFKLCSSHVTLKMAYTCGWATFLLINQSAAESQTQSNQTRINHYSWQLERLSRSNGWLCTVRYRNSNTNITRMLFPNSGTGSSRVMKGIDTQTMKLYWCPNRTELRPVWGLLVVGVSWSIVDPKQTDQQFPFCKNPINHFAEVWEAVLINFFWCLANQTASPGEGAQVQPWKALSMSLMTVFWQIV